MDDTAIKLWVPTETLAFRRPDLSEVEAALKPTGFIAKLIKFILG